MTAFVAMFGTFMLSTGLRTATYFVFVPVNRRRCRGKKGTCLPSRSTVPPLELHGYLIALSLFAAGAAIASRSNYTAAFLLAISAFLFAWKKTIPPREAFERDVQMRRAAIRVAIAAVPALLLTVWALLDGVAHRNQAAMPSVVANGEARAARHLPADPRAPLSTSGAGGYESVVLWPYPKKKEIVPPLALLMPPSSRRDQSGPSSFVLTARTGFYSHHRIGRGPKPMSRRARPSTTTSNQITLSNW